MSQQNLQQQSDTAGNYVLFSTEQLLEVKAGMDRTYLPFFDNANLSMGIYELKAGAVDEQIPTNWTKSTMSWTESASLKSREKAWM